MGSPSMCYSFVSFPQEGLVVLFKVPLWRCRILANFYWKWGNEYGLHGLDVFFIKINNHDNKRRIICWKAELATLPCHFEMCAKVFSSICRRISSKVSIFLLFLSVPADHWHQYRVCWVDLTTTFLLPLCIWKSVWHRGNACTGQEHNSEKIGQTDQRGEIIS